MAALLDGETVTLTERERIEYLDGQLWDARRLLEERDREIERLQRELTALDGESIRLNRENRELEERYENLLAAVGGVWPG